MNVIRSHQRLLLPTITNGFLRSTLNACTVNSKLITTQARDDVDGSTSSSPKLGIETTKFQRILLQVGSSIASLVNPHRHDMIACLGETSGVDALRTILQTMKESTEGMEILSERPRINSRVIDLEALGRLPNDTFGYAYKKFLDDNNVTPDSRMEVKFLNDDELIYTMTRYRECHDLVHTILALPTHMLGEVTVKWIEALNIGLPMCYGGAIFGALRLRPKQRQLYRDQYLPWALRVTKTMKPLMNVYWEKRWEQNIDELRAELGIEVLVLNKN